MKNVTAKQVAWAYLIAEGFECEPNWSYYAGYRDLDESDSQISKINSVGIDWDKTLPVESVIKDQFDGAFSDGSKISVQFGTLVFKDGTSTCFYTDECNFTLADVARFVVNTDENKIKSVLGMNTDD